MADRREQGYQSREQVKKQKDKPVAEGFAVKMANAILRYQNKMAERAGKNFSQLGTGHVKIVVAVFCLLGTGISTCVIVQALRKKAGFVSIDHANIPVLADEGPTRDPQAAGEEIKTWRNYLDSLQSFAPAVYDSLLLARPGLIDSIEFLEEIYKRK